MNGGKSQKRIGFRDQRNLSAKFLLPRLGDLGLAQLVFMHS